MTDGGASAVVVLVCTGNAARSVMAAAMLRRHRDDLDVRSAGTLVLEGRPMSTRTRLALARHGLIDPDHRSHQFDDSDAAAADVVVVMEPGHVEWLRSAYPRVTDRVVTLSRAVRDLLPPDEGDNADSRDLADRVCRLALADVRAEPWEEVVDPAGGDQDDFDRCADVLASLIEELAVRL